LLADAAPTHFAGLWTIIPIEDLVVGVHGQLLSRGHESPPEPVKRQAIVQTFGWIAEQFLETIALSLVVAEDHRLHARGGILLDLLAQQLDGSVEIGLRGATYIKGYPICLAVGGAVHLQHTK